MSSSPSVMLRPRHDHRADAVAVAVLRVQRDLVVVLVHHRDHVQPARQAERRLHLLPVLERRVLELEMAEDVVRLQRELLLRPDEMEVAVAGAGRQLQLRLGIVAVDLRRERTLRGFVHGDYSLLHLDVGLLHDVGPLRGFLRRGIW